MNQVVVLAILTLAFFSTLRAVTAASTERMLWGMLVASIGLGLAVQIRGDGYYGLLTVAIFVLTDIMIYLFFRSLKLMPDRPAKNMRGDRLLRTFFLWLSFCGIAGILLLAFHQSAEPIWAAPAAKGMSLLAEKIWSEDWLLATLPILGLTVLVTGGFFLVRREQ